MTLLKRILSEKRALVLPVATAIAVNVAFSAIAVYPLTVKVTSAERRSATVEQNLRTAETSFAAACAGRAGKDQADEALRRFYREVLPLNLAGAREITYARLAQMAEQVNLDYQRRSMTPERRHESPLARLRTTLVLSGAYRDVRRFIYELETAPEFVVIEEVLLEQGIDNTANLVLTLGVSTYYRVESHDT